MGALIGKSQECNYYKNEVDEFTGSTKIIMESESFISHTDSSLLKYYKKKKETKRSEEEGKIRDKIRMMGIL